MIDILAAMYENFRQRVTNPLLGSYLSFWLIYNASFVYYLLMFEGPVDSKIEYLKVAYSQSLILEGAGSCFNTAVPFVLALLYVIAFPWVHLGVQKLQNIPTKLRLKEVADLESSKLESFEDTEKVKARQEHIPEFTRLDIEVELAQKRVEVANTKKAADKLEKAKVQADQREIEKLAAEKREAENRTIEKKETDKFEAEKSLSKKKIIAARNDIKRSPAQIRTFRSLYNLGNMSSRRVHALMNYFDLHLDLEKYLKLGLTEPNAKTRFTNISNHVDKLVSDNEIKRKSNIPFKIIDRLVQFQIEHQYPDNSQEWLSLLTRAGPSYSISKIYEAMDLDAQGV